jgi:hypothetical protein
LERCIWVALVIASAHPFASTIGHCSRGTMLRLTGIYLHGLLACAAALTHLSGLLRVCV